jgi:hypothetical protein
MKAEGDVSWVITASKNTLCMTVKHTWTKISAWQSITSWKGSDHCPHPNKYFNYVLKRYNTVFLANRE